MKRFFETLTDRLKLKDTTLNLWDISLLYISLTSLLAVGLLAIHLFYPAVTALIGLVCTTALVLILRPKLTFRHPQLDRYVFLIILVALAFRLPPYLYLMGGQDQGTYVNISKQYEISHSLFAIDHYRETLTKEEQELYDKQGNYIMPSIEKNFPRNITLFINEGKRTYTVRQESTIRSCRPRNFINLSL